MKKYIAAGLWITILIAGLSALLYPTAGDFINSRRHYKAVYKYFELKTEAGNEESKALLAEAERYNAALLKKGSRFSFTEADADEYAQTLAYRGSDVIGVINIEKIKVSLPIYHGTSESVLQAGAGHLEGSSLPVGGAGTHSVITGHRGLPSSTLLTNLDRMVIGDTFTINVLNETLTYRVDQITVVLPGDVRNLLIEPESDYCTLLTCTPYGINTHRLLVRGARIDNIPENGTTAFRISQIVRINSTPAMLLLMLIFMVRSAKYHFNKRKLSYS